MFYERRSRRTERFDGFYFKRLLIAQGRVWPFLLFVKFNLMKVPKYTYDLVDRYLRYLRWLHLEEALKQPNL